VKQLVALLALAVALPGCAHAGDDELRIYLRQRLGPDGPPGQIAPVLAPVSRIRRATVPAPLQAVQDLRLGPAPDERARGFLPTLQVQAGPMSVAVENGAAVVELRAPTDVYGAAAIIYSLTALDGVERVRLRAGGRACCAFRHDGTVVETLTRRSYRFWQGEPCDERTGPTHVRCGRR
jgi:Sporulation and spore germination